MKKLSKISFAILSFVLLINTVFADVAIDLTNPHFYDDKPLVEETTISPVILVIVGIVVAVAICALVYLGIAKKNQNVQKNDTTVESNKEEQK